MLAIILNGEVCGTVCFKGHQDIAKGKSTANKVLIRHNSMKGSTVCLRAVSVYEAAWGLPTLPPHSETSVDTLRAGDLCGQQMQLWSVRVGSPSLQSTTWPDFLILKWDKVELNDS